MIILDGSIVTVALPSIQRDLGFSAADLTWTVNAYLIAFGGLLLLAGRLGDLLGRKRVFIAGLALFTAALAVVRDLDQSATADRREVRPGQRRGGGLGGQPRHDRHAVPEPRERGKAIGAFGFVGAAGASIGQVLGGTLTQPSTGTGSSSSTCRPASRPSRWPHGSWSPSADPASARRPMSRELSWSPAG